MLQASQPLDAQIVFDEIPKAPKILSVLQTHRKFDEWSDYARKPGGITSIAEVHFRNPQAQYMYQFQGPRFSAEVLVSLVVLRKPAG